MYHHKEVIPKIKEMIGQDVKILIMLRNPVNRTFSNYSHNTSSYEENNFRSALAQENSRIKNGFNSFWHYKKMSLYSEQVQAFMEQFNKVKVVLFEDFINDVEGTVSDIYRFLEVDSSFKPSSYLVNKKNTGQPKSKKVKSFLSALKKIKTLKFLANKILGRQRLKLFNELIDRSNLSKNKLVLDSKTEAELQHYFYDDIVKLEKLISRKSNWINTNGKNN